MALCKALNIDMHEHHDVVGIDKASIKSRIKELKKKRDAAIVAHDHAQLKNARRGHSPVEATDSQGDGLSICVTFSRRTLQLCDVCRSAGRVRRLKSYAT